MPTNKQAKVPTESLGAASSNDDTVKAAVHSAQTRLLATLAEQAAEVEARRIENEQADARIERDIRHKRLFKVLTRDLVGVVDMPGYFANNTTSARSEDEMLALRVNRGCMAVRTDLPGCFILLTENPDELDDWYRIPLIRLCGPTTDLDKAVYWSFVFLRDQVEACKEGIAVEERMAEIAQTATPPEAILDAVQAAGLMLDEFSARFDSDTPAADDHDDEYEDVEGDMIRETSRYRQLRSLIPPESESVAIAVEVVEGLEPELKDREGWDVDECLGCRIAKAIVGRSVRAALLRDCDSLPATIIAASAVALFYGLEEEHVVRGVTELWYQLDAAV